MEPRSFRQWGQLMVGATLALLAIGLAWAMAGGWLERSASGLAWLAFLLVIAYAVFARPCVVIDEGGVTLRNIVRDVHAPWASVQGASSSWNLQLETTAGRYSSWAISGTASPGRDALLRRSAASSGAPGSATSGPAGHVHQVDAGAVRAGLTPPPTGASAPALAALVERERSRHAAQAQSAQHQSGQPDSPQSPPAPPHPAHGDSAAAVSVRVAWLPALLVVLAAGAVFLAQAF